MGDTPDDTLGREQGLLMPSPTSPMRLDRQSGPNNAQPTRQSLRQSVATTELDSDRGKIMSPASPGLAPPQLQEAPDPYHRDNPTTAMQRAKGVPLQFLHWLQRRNDVCLFHRPISSNATRRLQLKVLG